MKHKGIVAVLVACMFALALGLVACGGSGGDQTAKSKEAFTGEWTLTGMESDGTTIGTDEIDQLKALDMVVTLSLKDDLTSELDLFGEPLTGTWEPKTATEASITIDNDTVPMTIVDGTLSLEQGGSKLEFQKA